MRSRSPTARPKLARLLGVTRSGYADRDRSESTVIPADPPAPQGAAVYGEVMGHVTPERSDPAQDAHVEFVFGEIWNRPGLSRTDRRWITLSCVAALAPESIGDHVYAALACGDISFEELLEGVLHFSVYCGWAIGLPYDAAVHREWARLRQDRGLEAPATTETFRHAPLDSEAASRRAEESYRRVNAVGYAPPGLSPYLETGVLGYVFGRMWTRPGLSVRARRMITLSCVGVSGAAVPVQSHVYAALASGDLSIEEMREVVLHFAAYAGWPKGSYLSVTVEQQQAAIEQGATQPAF